jgi:drug/metabolite transporter (DMT)-like permease
MPLDIIAIVLLGAALHATWNALVKAGQDKELDSTMVALGACVTALCALPFVPMPDPAAWPYIIGSVCIHFTYYRLVGTAYRLGDIGLVYPLMRGVAPLIVATASGVVLGQSLPPVMFAGVFIISLGVLAIAADFRGGHGASILVALLNAVVIAGYTFVDGTGAKIAGNPIAYTLWISILPPLPLFAFAFYTRGVAPVLSHVRRSWRRGLIGGAGSVASYGLALYAMTRAPVAAVAALRETSILFALLISVFILKEKAGPWRYVAGGLIALGALTMRLG